MIILSNTLTHTFKQCLGKAINLPRNNSLSFSSIGATESLVADMMKYNLLDSSSPSKLVLTPLAITIIDQRQTKTEEYKAAMREAIFYPIEFSKLAKRGSKSTQKSSLKSYFSSLEGVTSEQSERMSNIYLENIQFLTTLGIFPFGDLPKPTHKMRKLQDEESHIIIEFDAAYSKEMIISKLIELVNVLY